MDLPMIEIRDLRVEVFIGVPDEERAKAQEICISVKFPAGNAFEAGKNDDLSKSVDYFQAYQIIKKVSAQRPRKLIETLAVDLAGELLSRLDIVFVELEIKKFIFPDARWVSFRFSQRRE